MSARDEILSSIRRSRGVTGDESSRRFAVTERLSRAPVGVVPVRGQLEGAARISMFREQAESVSATVSLVPNYGAVAEEIASYLRGHNLPMTLRRGDDPRLAGLDWSATSVEMSSGPSDGTHLNALSHAVAGIAETGTLVLVSGADNPTTLNFLPDNHVVVVAASDIEPDMESVWGRLRARYGKGAMPRTVNMVTGPSRSADIEQTLLLGAHGPRRLHIVIVEDGARI
jgi:L-lactate dehydrogenase complex protein LldG